MRALAASLLLLVASALAHSQYASMKKTARFLTLQMWSGRMDEALASRGAAKHAPAAWRAGDPHWEAAKAKCLARFDKRLDDLIDAPEPQAVAAKSFTTILNDQDADAAGAKLAALGPELINYSDNVIIAVDLMMQTKATNPMDPAVRDEIKRRREKAGLHEPPKDDALTAAAMDKSVRQFMTARSAAVQALSTALNGQLELQFFDQQDAFAKDIDGAIRDCVKAHK